MSFGRIIGIYFPRFPVLCDRVVNLTFLKKSVAEIVMSFCSASIVLLGEQLQRRLKICDCLINLPCVKKSVAQVIANFRIIWLQLHSQPVVPNGVGNLPVPKKSIA